MSNQFTLLSLKELCADLESIVPLETPFLLSVNGHTGKFMSAQITMDLQSEEEGYIITLFGKNPPIDYGDVE